MTLPVDPFGRIKAPVGFNRQERVRLLLEVSTALVEGREPSREAALFVGGAIGGWLARGGNLERDFLRVKSCQGSRETPWAIAARLEADEDEPTEHVG